ncbi:MAG: 3-keto-5-aminohexanoate cleavage protein [Betaproteobacteria bacterium]|nr:3-keto-5-aminohexanoate cleavage protein [Betaproteobacteria bacterium]
MKPLIICAAVTGGASAKSAHHPVTPESVATAAVEAWRAGAAMVHIHARRDDGASSADVGDYRAIIDRILAAGCDAIINVSAGDNGGRASHAERLQVIETNAEVVSLGAGSLNIGNRLYDNSPAFVREMAARTKAKGSVPEIEVFDLGHLDLVGALVAEDLIRAPALVEFVFGLPGGLPSDPRLLPYLLERLPAGAEWAISSHATTTERYLPLSMLAFTQGGHVRTGMEDTIYLRPGELARTNAEMVEQWVSTARIWGRPVASPAEARRILGLVHS